MRVVSVGCEGSVSRVWLHSAPDVIELPATCGSMRDCCPALGDLNTAAHLVGGVVWLADQGMTAPTAMTC